jgi:hypothetical protein
MDNNTFIFSGTQPRQDLTEEEIVKQYGGDKATALDKWYADNVRFGVTFYNKNNRPYLYTETQDPYWSWGEAQRAREMFLYFQGDQSNRDYGWMTQLQGGGEMGARWDSGKEIWRFANHMANNYLRLAKSSNAVVKSYDHNAQSKLNKRLKAAMVKYDERPFFQDIANEFGVEYQPTNGQEYYSKEQLEKFFLQTPVGTAEQYGTDLITQIRIKNNYTTNAYKSFLHMSVGGRCMIEVVKRGGWPKWDIIPPWCQISQSLEDDDFGVNDNLKGWFRTYTPVQVLSRWGDQIQKKYGDTAIQAIANGDSSFLLNGLVSFPGWSFDWYNLTNGRIKQMGVCRIYWKSLVDTRMLPHKDDPDNKVFYLSSKSKKKGRFVEVIRTATLVMNKYIVDEGVCDEVRDPLDKSKLYCPLFYFQPNTIQGYNKSIFEQVKRIQDELSMLNYKFNEMVGFDMGVVLRVRGAKFQNASNGFEVLEEIKKARIIVEEESGELDNPLDTLPPIERIDFSTAGIAMQYLDMWKRKEQMMKDVLNVSDIALGTQRSYVGFDTQQATMDASANNLQYYYYGHGQFMTQVMQYSLELMKIMVQNGEVDQSESIVGQRGVYFLKEMKNNLFETLLVRVDFEDVVDEKQKAALLEDMRALVQAGGADMADLVNLRSMQTYSQMKAYVLWKTEKQKTEAQGQMLFDKIMGVINQNQMAQTQQNIADTQAAAALQMNEDKLDAKLAGDVLKYDAATMKNEQPVAQA